MTIDIDRSVIATGPKGELAHRAMIEHTERFERQLHDVAEVGEREVVVPHPGPRTGGNR